MVGGRGPYCFINTRAVDMGTADGIWFNAAGCPGRSGQLVLEEMITEHRDPFPAHQGDPSLIYFTLLSLSFAYKVERAIR